MSMRGRPLQTDPAQLGRGPLTRWLPVVGQVTSDPPRVKPFTVDARTTPRRFVMRVGLSIKRLTVPAALGALVQQIGVALTPVLAGLAVDRALATADTSQLVLWLTLLAVNVALLALGFRIAALLTMRSIQLVQHRLRVTLSRVVLHPPGRPVKRASGALLSTATNDVMRLADVIVITIFSIAEAAAIVFIAVMLVSIHWPLGVIVIVGAPSAVAAVALFRGPFTRRSGRFQSLLADAVGQATDLVTGYRIIKGVRAENEAVRRYRDASRKTLAGALHMVGALGRYLAASNLISNGFTMIVGAVAALFATQGHLSIGELIAVVGLAQALQAPLNQLTGFTGSIWAGAVASARRIIDLLHEAGATSGASYSPGSRKDDATATATPPVKLRLNETNTIGLAPGELLGLRGDDHAAARLVDAILYPEPDNEISIEVDGTPAQQISTSAYRSQVVVAPHAVTLFGGTIDHNLDILGASPHLRTQALRAAACDDIATDDVGEHGNRLSGGQRQRVALAQALATNAPVLVLHDPTTSVDSVTEAVIAERLPNVRGGGSTLLITSSPALLAICDRVIDLPPAARSDQKVSVS